jgi:hypothetical protein
MANHTTRAQRINARQDKIYEESLKLKCKPNILDEIVTNPDPMSPQAIKARRAYQRELIQRGTK